MRLQNHAFIIATTEMEVGIETARTWTGRELGLKTDDNLDVIVLRYGLFSVADARRISDLAAGASFSGEYKVLIIAASRVYHEAQNALLKIFEEPPPGTYLFFVLPTFGGLLPTFRSRVMTLEAHAVNECEEIPEIARVFIRGTKEKRSTLIKKLTSGKDEEERREHRDEVIAIVNGIEAVSYKALGKRRDDKAITTLLFEIAFLRNYLYERSAPVRMILEHLSLVLPKNLV